MADILYNVTCYLSTGFTNKNIPDSPAVLNKLPLNQIVTPKPIYKRQTLDINTILLELPESTARYVDYISLTGNGNKTYYTVNGYTMRSPLTAEFSVNLDGLTSLGGVTFNPAYPVKFSGWVKRRIKKFSETQNIEKASKCILSEPFSPTMPEKQDIQENVLGLKNEYYYNWVLATVDLTEISKEADIYKSSESTPHFVTVPKLPVFPSSTQFKLNDLTYTALGTCIYDGKNEDVQKGIASVRSLGIDGAIQKSYNVPYGYVASRSLNNKARFDSVASKTNSKTLSFKAIPTETKIYNYKSALLYQKLKLLSISSGDEQEYNMNQLEGKFDVIYFADLSPDGKPYMRPLSINGSKENIFYGAVQGSTWSNQPLVFVDRSGIDLLKNASNRQSWETGANMVGNIATDIIKGVAVGALTGGLGLAVGGAGVAKTAVKGAVDLDNIRIARQEAERINAPEIKFTPSNNIQNYTGNDFTAIRTNIDIQDIIRFDEFLNRYGEAVFEPLKREHFFTKKYYNYIECEDVIVHAKHNREILSSAALQLQNGVRLWHELPKDEYLERGKNLDSQ